MAHAIEAAKSARSTCVTCGEKIVKGEVRVAELYQDAHLGPPRFESHHGHAGERYSARGEGREAIHRYHHLACAAAKHPAVLKTALDAAHDPTLIPDRAALDQQLAEALDAERKARVAAATARLAAKPEAAEVDPNLEPLLVQLADHPEDVELLTVAGDLFQSRGDPRGELISIQLATRTVKRERGPEIAGVRGARSKGAVEDPTARTLIQRRDDLMAELSPRLDSADRSVWGLGFIRRLELGTKSGGRLLELSGLWTHPSLRVLAELKVEMPLRSDDTTILAQLAELLPRSLRRLEIGGHPQGTGALGKLVSALPRLEELGLLSRRADPALTHPRIAKLALHGEAYDDSLALLDPGKLPAVREISIHQWSPSTGPFEALSRTKWLAVIDRLHVDEPSRAYMQDPAPLAMSSAETLRDALAGRKLVRLEITGVPIPVPVHAVLAASCEELVCPAASVVLDDTTTHVEHSNKPEWGRGKIVKRHDGKLEVKFPKIGVKVFKADAPFLKPCGG